ncbi:MAG: NADH-quinone oxidoreductase subunit C, partial [Phormidesmis sp.]
MADQEEKKPKGEASSESPSDESAIVEAGEVSLWLSEQGFAHEVMEPDHAGVEILKVDPEFLLPFATALYAYGFNYLRCQSAYDSGPGKELVSVYDLTKLSDDADSPAEVRIKCF